MPDTIHPPSCQRCGGATRFQGRVSLPPHHIFSCGACGETMWVAKATPTFWPVAEGGLPQQQQQQQPQTQAQKKPQ